MFLIIQPSRAGLFPWWQKDSKRKGSVSPRGQALCSSPLSSCWSDTMARPMPGSGWGTGNRIASGHRCCKQEALAGAFEIWLQKSKLAFEAGPERSTRLVFITHNGSFTSLFLELSFSLSLSRTLVCFEMLPPYCVRAFSHVPQVFTQALGATCAYSPIGHHSFSRDLLIFAYL